MRLNLECWRARGDSVASDGTNGRTTFFASPLPLNTAAAAETAAEEVAERKREAELEVVAEKVRKEMVKVMGEEVRGTSWEAALEVGMMMLLRMFNRRMVIMVTW